MKPQRVVLFGIFITFQIIRHAEECGKTTINHYLLSVRFNKPTSAHAIQPGLGHEKSSPMIYIHRGLGTGCQILKDPSIRTVGVTPSEAAAAAGLAIVTYSNVGHVDKRERIRYTSAATVSDERNKLDAYMLVDRNDSRDLLKQAGTHIGREGFKTTTITCVKSDCDKPNASMFKLLWGQSMHYVVVSCRDTLYIYRPFEDKVVHFKGIRMSSLYKEFIRMWSDMKGTIIKVTAIQESLSFIGNTPDLGSGLDSSFLCEFSRHKNFTPVVLNGKNYKLSNLQVWTHQAEFGVNSRFIALYEQKYMMSSVIYGDDICLIARRKSSLRGWEVFQSLFRVEVWFCLPVALFVTNSVLSLVCRQRSWWKWLDVTLKSLFTVPLYDDIKESKQRLILGSCFLFSLIFISYVQGMLYQIVRMEPPVEFPSEDLVYKFVHVMKREPYNGSSTVVRKKEYTLSAKEGHIKSHHYSVKCPGYSRNLAYILSYGTAMEPHINKFVEAAFEAGLPDAWFAKTLNARKQYREDDDHVKVLDIVDFEVAFFELLIGLSVSSLVFIGEFVSNKIVYVG